MTAQHDFPTAGMELRHLLIVSDYTRSLAFYRDVLGATVVREFPGTLCFLNFGSGTNKQDMVDCEGQSVLKKEEPFMVTITVHCPHCQSDALVRNGHARNGKQLYRCRACGRQSRENPTPHAYPQARSEEILHAYQERSSLRGLTRTFGVSRTTVSTWIKKK